MKKIYLSLIVAAGFATQASAQSIDLAAGIMYPATNQSISPGQTLDTSKILCGIFYLGPDNIQQGDGVYFMSSFSRPGTTAGTYYLDGVSFGSDLTMQNTGTIFVIPNMNMIGSGHTAAYKLSSDSIHVMFDWDQWSNNDSIVVVEPPFVNGKSYGFFFRAVDVRDASGTIIGTDPEPGDNIAVSQIKWSAATSVQSLTKKDDLEFGLYPNPASDVANFSLTLAQPSHCTITVRDITGRIIMLKNFGHQAAGEHQFSTDISKLPAGNYMIEMNTDQSFGTRKLTVVR